jgi:hypothetical protein
VQSYFQVASGQLKSAPAGSLFQTEKAESKSVEKRKFGSKEIAKQTETVSLASH